MNRKIENKTVYFATMFEGGGMDEILDFFCFTEYINNMIIHSFRNLPSSNTN